MLIYNTYTYIIHVVLYITKALFSKCGSSENNRLIDTKNKNNKIYQMEKKNQFLIK